MTMNLIYGLKKIGRGSWRPQLLIRKEKKNRRKGEQRGNRTGRKNDSCKSHQIEGMVNEFPCRKLIPVRNNREINRQEVCEVPKIKSRIWNYCAECNNKYCREN